MGQIVEGALAAVAPVSFAPGAIVVLPLRIDVVALALGTLRRAIFPPEHMDVGLTLVDMAEGVDVRVYRHG